MIIIIVILTYAASLKIQLPSYVNVLNLCSNTKLVSPVYFGNGLIFSKLPDQQIDIDTKMNAHFEINAIQNDFEGALLLKLQRCPDGQYNMDTSTTKTDKNETTYIHMLAAWKVKDSKLFVRVVLVEHTEEFTWNEEKLKELYTMNCGWLEEYNGLVSHTWLADNNMVFKTTFVARNL
jgi:hypothetical protein